MLVAAPPSFRSIHSWSSGLSTRMVCSFGALKLCERHPVNGYTFRLASYYAIGTYSVLGAKPILGCISRFGRFTGTHRDYLRDLISDISLEIICEIGSPISPRSGYCPSQLSTDRLPPVVCPFWEGGSGTPLGVYNYPPLGPARRTRAACLRASPVRTRTSPVARVRLGTPLGVPEYLCPRPKGDR